MNMTPLLKVERLSKRFGGNQAVDQVSFEMPEGIILGLIGPNGSGKTTVLNMLSGILRADEGSIFLQSQEISTLKPSTLARLGVMRMFQMTRVFSRISSFDNLLIAGQAVGVSFKDAVEIADQLIEELELEAVKFLDAGQLSGGAKKITRIWHVFYA